MLKIDMREQNVEEDDCVFGMVGCTESPDGSLMSCKVFEVDIDPERKEEFHNRNVVILNSIDQK